MPKSRNQQKYKYEAPEGGWGFLISFGLITVFVVGFGIINCFGLIFNDFLKKTSGGTGVLPMLNSCSFGAISIAGLFYNSFAQRFSKRMLGVFGATLFCLSGVFQLFAQSLTPLFVAAVLHGASLGLMLPTSLSTFNCYFVRRRAMMMTTSHALIGLGQTVVPITIHYLMETFGFRGCLLILTAVNTNCILAMAVMHPVEWHLRKVPIIQEKLEKIEEEPCENDENGQVYQLNPLITEVKNMEHSKSPASIRRLRDAGSKRSSRKTSIASMGDWTGSGIVAEAFESKPKTAGKWKLFVDGLDLALLMQPIYVNIVVGVSIAFYADFSFFSFLPLYLFEMDYSKADAAGILSIGAGADLVSRCALALLATVSTNNPRYIFLAGVILSVFARYGFMYVSDFWSVAVLTGAIGFLKTWMHVPLALILADYLPSERFSSGFGLFLFLKGVIMFAIGPIVRYLRDMATSYETVFQFLNLFLIITAVAWSTEIILMKIRKRNSRTSEITA